VVGYRWNSIRWSAIGRDDASRIVAAWLVDSLRARFRVDFPNGPEASGLCNDGCHRNLVLA